ncbi:MAG: SH3 domain-containing protein [Caldilineaceae bacterium]
MNIKPMLIRTIITGLAILLVMGTTGCSIITGVFASEAATTTDIESTSSQARILVPTPVALEVAVELTATAEPTPPVIAAPPLQQEQAPPRRIVTITGASVNLRSQPSTDTAILRTVPAGTTFDFVDQNSAGDWYQICCVNGSLAWVYATLAELGTEAAAPIPAPSVTTTQAPSSSSTLFTANPALLNISSEAPAFTTTPADSGTRYEALEQGFAITLPPSWQPLDLNQERLAAGLRSLAAENPGAAALVEGQLQGLLNARFTFFAADLTPALLTTGYATTASLLKQPLPTGILLELYTQLTVKQTQEKFALTSPVSVTPLTLPAGKSVMLAYTMTGGAEIANQPLAVTQYLIMQGQTVYAFTFTTTAAQADTYAATFAAIAESFQLLAE